MAKTHGTNVHTIDGKTYVEVERKAEVGDFIINNKGNEAEGIFKVTGFTDEYVPSYTVEHEEDMDGAVFAVSIDRSITLEPVASEEWPPLTSDTIELTANDIRWQPDKVIDLLANLARRVSSLERQNDDHLEALEEQSLRVASLEQQLSDTQNNVIRQAEELAANEHSISELYDRLAHVEADREGVSAEEAYQQTIFMLCAHIARLDGGAR